MTDINNFIKVSTKVFEDCLLPNGCLVAAPTHQDYYPKDAKSYMYSWVGRDGGFALAAMLILGKDYYEPVLKWLWERAEDFQVSSDDLMDGLIFKDYHPNGLLREHQFQPDQGGTLLWSIGFKKDFTGSELSDFEKKIVNHIAFGIMKNWDKNHFKRYTEDLWEERNIPKEDGNFTYSLAACSKGMYSAYDITGNEEFKKVADSIKNSILKVCEKGKDRSIPRSFGPDTTDETLDGSISGLVWPFNIGFSEEQLKFTLDALEKNIVSDFGVHRYPGDTYEGADSHNHENHKAGAWPLLTFWLSIAYSEMGEKEKAEKYFNLVFEKNNDKDYIPEQIFCCEAVPWTGVSPLLWSHAKAVIAAWKLGLIK